METSLHRDLKRLYAGEAAHCEVRLAGYRIDAVADGELIEVQHGPLAVIRDKVRKLLAEHRVRVVKPIIARKQLVYRRRKGGRIARRRLSPKQGKLLDLFDELIHFTRVFPHPGLVLEVAAGRGRGMAVSRPRSPPLAPRWGLSSRGSEADRDPIATSVGDDRRPHGPRFLSVAGPFPHGSFGGGTEHSAMVGSANCVLPAPDGRMAASRQGRKCVALLQWPRPYGRVSAPASRLPTASCLLPNPRHTVCSSSAHQCSVQAGPKQRRGNSLLSGPDRRDAKQPEEAAITSGGAEN